MNNASEPVPGKKVHIGILDFLRGIAALSVVLLHYSHSAIPSVRPNALTEYFEWGRLGVQVFFVISGFIIPYSMYVAGYSLRHAGRFIVRRLARLGPPSWAAIGLMFVLYFGAIALKGQPIDGMIWPGTDPMTIVSNLFYAFVLLGHGAYIDIYWTLEVEFQYYILIALLLPLILRLCRQPWALSALLAAVMMTYYLDTDRIIFFKNTGFFILGILLFLYRQQLIARGYFIYASVAAMLLLYGQSQPPHALAAVIAFLIIAFVHFENPVTTFLGRISYSLYITHMFSGIASEFVLKRFTGSELTEPWRVIMMFVYVGFAIGFAAVFYRFVEKPFIAFSQRFSWNRRKAAAA